MPVIKANYQADRVLLPSLHSLEYLGALFLRKPSEDSRPNAVLTFQLATTRLNVPINFMWICFSIRWAQETENCRQWWPAVSSGSKFKQVASSIRSQYRQSKGTHALSHFLKLSERMAAVRSKALGALKSERFGFALSFCTLYGGLSV